MLVGRWTLGELATARELFLGEEEQGADLPAVSQEFRCRTPSLVPEVPQQAGVDGAMPRAWLWSGYQEAGTIKSAAPVHLQAANHGGRHRPGGEGGNAVVLLDREDGRHGTPGDAERECAPRFGGLSPLI